MVRTMSERRFEWLRAARRLRLGLLVLLLVASGCATHNIQRATSNSAYSALIAQQLWHLQYEGRHYRLPAMLSLDDAGVRLVLMNEFGQRLVTVEDAPGSLKIDSHQSHPVDPLWPRLVEAMYRIYWPWGDLQNSAANDWQCVEADGFRQITAKGKQVATIDLRAGDPWQTSAGYTRADDLFSLRIESRLLESRPVR